MVNRVPNISAKHKICIICEGSEEYAYLEKLKELMVWDSQYDVQLDNAKGNGNIPARYQDRYQNGAYELILVFCDTERKPYEQYQEIKEKINEFHGIENAADEVVIFANPCTMQVIIKHWTDVNLKSPAKKMNAPLIQECAGVENYKGREDQIKVIMECITAENYEVMYKRVKELVGSDEELGSSNFYRLIEHLADAEAAWIEVINDKLE